MGEGEASVDARRITSPRPNGESVIYSIQRTSIAMNKTKHVLGFLAFTHVHF